MNAPALSLEDRVWTDVGLVRAVNEDSYLLRPEIGVWAVADGMGGHARGDWASRAVVEALAEVPPGDDFDRMLAGVTDAIRRGNARIHTEGLAQGSYIGTTVVAALVRDRRLAIVWAGDSRAYLLRHGTLHRLTRDHTQVQELVDRGMLTASQAIGHPMGHILMRAVGVAPTIEIDAVTDTIGPGDIVLLCSDGVHGVVSDAEIAASLAPGGGGPASLVEMVKERGAPDNLTLVTIHAGEPTLVLRTAPGLPR